MDAQSRTLLSTSLMDRINFKHLDIPIIRSCNLACEGCITHSNHKNIKGLVDLDQSIEWIDFWAKYLDPNSVTIFGGEPLLHPDFLDWAVYLRHVWGPRPQLKVNTNGYYLNKLIDNVDILFNDEVELTPVISIQTAQEPYLSTVTRLSQELKDKIFEFRSKQPGVKTIRWDLWSDEFDKKWYNLEINGITSNVNFVLCEMHKLPWCTHYEGYAEQMRPVYEYNDVHYEENHKWCQAKPFVTLYKGDIYKCPPVGVLEHTLDTFDIKHNEIWKPFIEDYTRLKFGATQEDITNWFQRHDTPEKVCNMCGFSGPKATGQNLNRFHSLKDNWKYPIQTS